MRLKTKQRLEAEQAVARTRARVSRAIRSPKKLNSFRCPRGEVPISESCDVRDQFLLLERGRNGLYKRKPYLAGTT